MRDSIEKLVKEIIEESRRGQWSRVHRLTIVVKELVKIEVANNKPNTPKEES